MLWTSARSQRGFTLLEMMLVAVIIMILMTLALPVIVKTKGRSLQLQCLSQLKQTGIGFVSYAQDHADRFPFQVAMKDGGTLELLKAAKEGEGDVFYAFRHFQAISNEVNEPKILRCPADFRTAAGTLAQLKNDNVSYFLAVTADPTRPESLLSGDRNFVDAGAQSGSIVKLTAMSKPKWTRAGHEYKGNLLFAGGHVERTGNAGLQVAMQNATGPLSLWMPSPAPSSGQSAASGGGASSGSTTAQSPDAARGFDMLQNFFQSPASASGAAPSPSSSSQPSGERASGRTPRSSALDSSYANNDSTTVSPTNEPAKKRTLFASIPTSVPVPESEPTSSTDVPSEPPSGILGMLIEPERSGWWWLILAVSLLIAFILGFLIFRHRRAQQHKANAWAPAWEVPQSPGRR